jgi:hypothetical protein
MRHLPFSSPPTQRNHEIIIIAINILLTSHFDCAGLRNNKSKRAQPVKKEENYTANCSRAKTIVGKRANIHGMK